ncbi:uncharacterized protein LOC115623000 isoform X2 [Scaptodrosophila lebanonensis]|uniref:Uncharacterized protein LOC115623000 isoform X2 n=1 Tax=Drosophila lebanonensis TaxID=7225 RepID=A0A6J2TDF3_DROLE|nr:uncharacterized protein LOC115623000 isoform X2 [Scaptodrosophila lebanonensis]
MMNSSKEAKSAAKAQKKSQKANKKQLQKQQQQQQLTNGTKNGNVKSPPTAKSAAKVAASQQNTINNNNNNNEQNHNNTSNNNISQKFREHYEAERRALMNSSSPNVLPRYENVPKMERANSFSLRGKISKLMNHITGSKENLTKMDEENTFKTPFTFTRSRSMILLRRPNRRSFIEPQLEQLSEEAEKAGEPISPRKNSLAETAEHSSAVRLANVDDDCSPQLRRRADSSVNQKQREYITPARRQSAQPLTSTPLEETPMQRKPSLVSLTKNELNYNPQLNFQKRRSSTLISSFKTTFGLSGGNGGEKKKDKLNPKWSASLQSLQAIDNMVSYANMSFIDYDKFNGYEKQLERQQSAMSLAEPQIPQTPQLPLPSTAMQSPISLFGDANGAIQSPASPSYSASAETTPKTVVRRRKRSTSSLIERPFASRTSLNSGYNLETDYEHNLDRVQNVYRDSLDSRTLELLNARSRNSYIQDQNFVIDWLNLENGAVARRCTLCAQRIARNNSMRKQQDAVDGHGKPKRQLKSKSLTHLDGLDTVVACQHGTATTASSSGAPVMASAMMAECLGRQANMVSSSEYFSVCFNSDTSHPPDEEFIRAAKGVTLFNALNQSLRRRNLSFSQITITDNNPTPSFLDAGPTPLTSSLDENTDVENLAGHHLIITERDSSRKTLQKAASFGSRQRPPRLLSSASTEETSESANVASKQIKPRWSSIFGVKNPQQSQLCELLNSYSKSGVPQQPDALNFQHPDLPAALDYLNHMHKSWRDIVDSDGMSDNEIKIQTAIWELVTTEVYYIHALQTVTDLFLACLAAVQEERLLADVDQHRLFSNVRAVCEANIRFWTLWLYPMVRHSEVTREPLRCAFFQEGFIAFASIFAPYKIYCAEQSTCQFYCKELNQNNPLFTSYLAWCESQKKCNRLRLADIVVRPMQRLTKYSLLLAAIKKHMSDVDEIEAIDTMIHSVENFVGSVNNHLTMRQENERLKGVMARIESYDVVDTNNESLDKLIKQHSQMFDLCAPMRGCPVQHVRHLFMEGDHRFKDNLGKVDVHCFLLTDMLLVCKTIAKKGLGALKVIRQPYLTDHLMVHLGPNNTLNCVYLNEFQVATTAFTLQCTEAKNWHDALWRAKTIYQRLKRGVGGGAGSVGDSFRFGGSGASGGTADSLGVRKSPMNSSICSHVSSANNSHSGSVEWNDSRNISVDFEKTNSLSSDEGSSLLTGGHGQMVKMKQQQQQQLHKPKIATIATGSGNTLLVQPINHLGQSLPNLNLHHSHTVPLRRGNAFSTSTKNPPLLKTRNITSQNSINWHQIPATPTPPSPQSQHNSPGNVGGASSLQKSLPALITNDREAPGVAKPSSSSHQTVIPSTSNHNLAQLQRPLSTETDV